MLFMMEINPASMAMVREGRRNGLLYEIERRKKLKELEVSGDGLLLNLVCYFWV